MECRPTKAEAPDGLAAALEKRPSALTAYRNPAPSHRREYLEWIEEAKRSETRHRRIDKAAAMLAG